MKECMDLLVNQPASFLDFHTLDVVESSGGLMAQGTSTADFELLAEQQARVQATGSQG